MGMPARARPGHSRAGRETQQRDAANMKWARDPDRLLPGERSETAYVEEAAQWVEMYRELRQYNLELIAAVSDRLSENGHQPDGAEGPDLELIQAHLERIEFRLRHWERMRIALADEISNESVQTARGGRTRPSR
jgi:hypothetical protein